MTRTQELLMVLELASFGLRYTPTPKPPAKPVPERISVEEQSRYIRIMRERCKAEREWDRNTFEEVGP